MEKPLNGQLYVHINGSIIFILAFSKHYKTKEEIVIYREITSGEIRHIPLNEFFTPHPKTEIPRYRFIRPEKVEIKGK